MKRISFSVIVTAASVLFSFSALAAEYEGTSSSSSNSSSSRVLTGNSPSIGVFGGYSELPAGETGSIVGLELGFKPSGGFQLAVNGGFAGLNEDFKRTTVLGKAAVSFGGDIPLLRSMYFGATGGWVNDTVDLFGGNISVSNDYWAVGPTVGFDEPINQAWTIGAEAKYLANFEDAEIDNTFTAAAALKYWY